MALSSSTGQWPRALRRRTRSRLVSFRHNGSEPTAASFRVVVEDGNEDNSRADPCDIQFHRQPRQPTLPYAPAI
ncbi:hypothetical protein F2981_16370 [Sinorhizobium meliloti]|nr:hypothetical protein [Sinorhizobium meliloti]